LYPENGIIQQASLVAAVEQAADGVVITDATGKIQYVNPAFTGMTGYTSEQAVGQNPRILKSGRQTGAVYQGLRNTIRSGQVWHGELINRRRDGTLYDEEMQVSPVRGDNGDITGYIAIKRDVTERRAAEQAPGFLAAIVESSEDAIVTYSLQGIILTWNHGAQTIFGHSAQDAVGKPVSILVLKERLAELSLFTDQISHGNAIPHHWPPDRVKIPSALRVAAMRSNELPPARNSFIRFKVSSSPGFVPNGFMKLYRHASGDGPGNLELRCPAA
jgi:PAS domain S-box-containing protein